MIFEVVDHKTLGCTLGLACAVAHVHALCALTQTCTNCSLSFQGQL